jgi:Uma2 family endonuclease
MVATRERHPMSPQEYFDWEAKQELRHEYFEGDVFAMAGGSIAHGRLGLNLGAMLKAGLRGKGCIPLNSDCKLGISEKGPFIYPDVSVTCDDRDKTARQFIQYPCLIIEVLSPSTEAYDRGGKFALYRRLASLQEYVLVSSESRSVEVFRRTTSGTWEFKDYGEEDSISLTSVGLTLAIAEIYEDVTLETVTPDYS